MIRSRNPWEGRQIFRLKGTPGRITNTKEALDIGNGIGVGMLLLGVLVDVLG